MARRLTPLDRLILFTTLPLFALVLAAHMHENARTGLAQLPVFAKWNPGDYPQVGGYRLETDSSGSGLEIGDRLIRIGDEDLHGLGYVGFQAVGLSLTTPGHPVPLVFERDGVRRTVPLESRPHPFPWTRMPILILIPTVCVLLMLRAPEQSEVRRFYGGLMAYAFGQAHFYGGPIWQTYVAQIVWSISSVLMIFLVLNWTRHFPPEMPNARRVSRLVPWGAALAYAVFVRGNYLLAWPLPIEWVPRISFASHGIATIVGLSVMVWNYAYAAPVGRRRLRWILLGTAVGSLPVFAAGLAPTLFPDWSGFREAFAAGFVASAIWMLGAVMATIRDNAFDIDRLIGAAAAGALATGAAVAGLVIAVPVASELLAESYSVDPTTTRLGLAALIGALVISATTRVRPHLDRLLFPEQAAQEVAASEVGDSLGDCETPEVLLDRSMRGFAGVFGVEDFALYVERDGRFIHQGAPGSPWPRALPADARPSSRIRPANVPAVLEPWARIVVPITAGDAQRALLCLGTKDSGDIFTNRDARLLGQLAARTEREWLRLLKQAADRESLAKTNLLAEAGHDLRQPLHAVSLLAEALRGKLEDPEVRSLVERIGDSTHDLDEMLTSLLDLSKLDAGGISPEVADVPLSEVFTLLERDFASQAAVVGTRLEIEPTASIVRSDRMLLVRVLRNLVANALRYAEGGNVRVRAVVAPGDDDRVRIEVEDDGPGIPEENQREVFEAFRQLPGSSRAGLGLGLSIVDGLTRLLGHELDLESEAGQGTLFRVHCMVGSPADEASSHPVESTSDRGVLTGLGARLRRALVLDDDERVREATMALLEGWGCEVRGAGTGAEAEAQISADWQPDLFLADHDLGAVETGPEVVARLRARLPEDLVVVILMAESAPGQLERVRALGDPVLRKPVRPARLRSLLTAFRPDAGGAASSRSD